jgi:hypothetical protein
MPGCGCGGCTSPSKNTPDASSASNTSPQGSSGASSSTDGGKPPCPKTCHHPINATCTLMAKNLRFGLRVGVTWESPTGNLQDLSSCHITEHITVSVMPNPPFAPNSRSGQTFRIPAGAGIAATSGRAQDTHTCAGIVSLVAGGYQVDQTYDYNCSVCGAGWTPFVTYVISYTVYENPAKKGEWSVKTLKTGPGGPFESDEKY